MGNSTPRVHTVSTLTCGQTAENLDVGFTLPTAVEVVQVDTQVSGLYIDLIWRTRGESATYGFYVYRAYMPDGPYTLLTPYPVYPTRMDGTYAEFRYRDTAVKPGRFYYYKLVSLFDGTSVGPIVTRTLGRADLRQRIYLSLLTR